MKSDLNIRGDAGQSLRLHLHGSVKPHRVLTFLFGTSFLGGGSLNQRGSFTGFQNQNTLAKVYFGQKNVADFCKPSE